MKITYNQKLFNFIAKILSLILFSKLAIVFYGGTSLCYTHHFEYLSGKGYEAIETELKEKCAYEL